MRSNKRDDRWSPCMVPRLIPNGGESVAMRGVELHGCLGIEIRNEAGEVLGKHQEFKYSNQLSVVRREKCSLKVKVVEDNALLVRVYILRTKVEMSDRRGTIAVSPKALLF